MPNTEPGPADLLFSGGVVHTQDPSRPRAEALAVRGSRLVAVGSRDEVEVWRGPGTRVVDLAGRAVLPGFVDAHVHFASYARQARQVDLEGIPTLDEGLAIIREAAGRLPEGAWLRGSGWDRNRWGRLPTAADLDLATGDRPAALSSRDGHSVWVNRAALRLAGVVASTDSPPGGHIERGPDGEPTGVLFENAQALVRSAMPAYTVDEVVGVLREALPRAAAAGITGIHNLEDATTLRAFQALRRERRLTLRVFHGIPHASLPAAARLGVETGLGDAWLRVGLVKIFSDGALGSRTAFMLEPYEGRADAYRGIPTVEPETLRRDLLTAAEAGLGVAVHAIGDAAVRMVLDAMAWARAQNAAGAAALFRVEHAQIVDPSDVPRFAALRVVASMQPIHATSDWRTANTHWGARCAHAYGWRAMLDAGATLAFGTDAPVERIEPLHSLYAAVTRIAPDGEPAAGWVPAQRVTLHEALRAYSLGAAEAEGAADRKGMLAPGRLADLVVLSRDPLAHEPAALLETDVDLTVVGGRVVHER